MKPRYMREKTLWKAMAFVLAILVAPALFADEQKRTTPNTGGHSSQQTTHSAPAQRSAPPAQHTAPSGGTHTPSTPQTHTPQAGGGTRTPSSPGGYNPAGHTPGGTRTPNTPVTTNPGGTGTRTPGGYNPNNRPSTSPTTNQSPSGSRNPGYNPGGNNNPGGTGNRTPGYNPAGGTGNRNPGYNPAGGTGNRNTGNNPAGNTGNRNPGYNPAGGTGNRNPGYNPGNNAGNRNPGSNRPAFRPPAGAQASSRPGGGMSYQHNGATYHTNNTGHLTSYSRPGADVRYSNSGRVSSAHFTRPDRSQVYVNHGPRGERTIVTVRADRSRVVSYGPRYGFYERPMGRAGYVSRTYIYGGRPYARVYQSYGWRGISYYRYVSPVYYAPAFYGWAWSPWRAPIVFSWGWRRDPWYGYYGGYFTPAPMYPTASLWLTDYLLAENLRLAYESRQAAMQPGQPGPPPEEYQQQQGAGPVTLTPEIKAAIAEEVRQQLEAERAAAASGQPQGNYNQPTNGYPPQQGAPNGYTPTGGEAAPPALDPKQRIFVVSASLDVQVAGGQGCALTPGDIILRTGDNLVGGNRIGVSVLSSKPGDCPVNSAAELDVVALQEMHNQFREQIDSGMKQLADNQGKNGLPPAPSASPRLVAEGQAPAEQASTVEEALMRQQADASQAEQEVQQAANSAQ